MFPVEIENAFGVARVEAKPERIVSLSFIGHDFLLALGIQPYALRKWYGSDPYGVWVWGHDALGDAQPIVMQGEIDIERIALLAPDLITAQWSGITEREYDLLSRIAPTLGPAPGYGNWGTPWQDMLLRLGQATGRGEEAAAVVRSIEARFAEVRSRHPEWQGASATMSWAGALAAYTDEDLRGQFLEALGFEVPDQLSYLPGGNAYFKPLPVEDISSIDLDVLVWLDPGGTAGGVLDMPLRNTMRAHREGREVYAGPLLSAALSHSSPLSLEYALDELVPLLERAMDGDPATVVPSMFEAGLLPMGN